MASSDEPDPTPPEEDSLKLAEDDEDTYGVSESERPAAEGGGGASPGGGEGGPWYVGLPDGQREGPLPQAEMERRIDAGDVTRADLVWRQGMAGWAAAGTVPELFPAPAPAPAPEPAPDPAPGAPLPPRPAAGSAPDTGQAAAPLRTASADVMRRFDSIFERPLFFRAFGRVCAVLAVFMLLVAVIAALMDKGGWFLYVFWFALLFLVGEATAAILDRLDRSQDGPE
jgi:hypothetical protein